MVNIGVFVVEVAMLNALATALGIVVVLEMEWIMLPPKSAVLDALKGPETLKPPITEEEAPEKKPPWSNARLEAMRVPDALSAPDTCSPPLTDEEALEMNPPPRVERLVPVTVKAPPMSAVLDALKIPDT